jgi:hypothetical protein
VPPFASQPWKANKPVNLHHQQASTSHSQACATKAYCWERCSDIDLPSANTFMYSIQAGREGNSGVSSASRCAMFSIDFNQRPSHQHEILPDRAFAD